MFGHQDNIQDDQKIPDHKIEEALQSVSQSEASESSDVSTESWQHPGEPLENSSNEPKSQIAPNDDLASIKQRALNELSPLIKHLDQAPEDKFKIIMQMIQASDDQGLIKDAYEVAGNIQDEAKRAQALLDVVNEINYFNQHKS